MISNSNHHFQNLIILFLSIILSCSNDVDNDIDNSLAFAVGPISVTRYELQKNLKPLINTYAKEVGISPPDDSIRAWKNDFIDKFYFAADAHEKRYYEDVPIENEVNDVACFMLTQKRGLVQKRLIRDEVTIDEHDLPQLYKKRQHKFYFDFIKFRDMTQLQELLGDTLKVKTASQFSSLMNSLKSNQDVLSKSVDGLPWPYTLLWDICDRIYEMEAGQISDFIQTETGVYIVHLKKKEPAEQESYEKFKQEFPRFYELAKGFWLIDQNESRILEESKMQIDEDNFNMLAERLDKIENKRKISSDSMQDILRKTVLSYEIESQKVEKSISEFLDFYKRQPLKKELKSEQILRDYIARMVIEDYLLLEAERLGITKEQKFVLDRKNYKNNVVYHEYEQNELKIEPITEQDISDEYASQKEQFLEPISGVYTILEFQDRQAATDAYIELQKSAKEKSIEQLRPDELPGALHSIINDTIDYRSDEFSAIMKMDLKSPESGIIGPKKIGDVHKIFCRIKQLETDYKPIEEVHTYLNHYIKKRRLAAAKKKLLPELKRKYKLTIYNIDTKLPTGTETT